MFQALEAIVLRYFIQTCFTHVTKEYFTKIVQTGDRGMFHQCISDMFHTASSDTFHICTCSSDIFQTGDLGMFHQGSLDILHICDRHVSPR
jgi:hypothetical protein